MMVVSDLNSMTRIGRYEPPKFTLAQFQWLRPITPWEPKNRAGRKAYVLAYMLISMFPNFYIFWSMGTFLVRNINILPRSLRNPPIYTLWPVPGDHWWRITINCSFIISACSSPLQISPPFLLQRLWKIYGFLIAYFFVVGIDAWLRESLWRSRPRVFLGGGPRT